MSGEQVMSAVMTAVASGLVSALSAVVALKIHVNWINKTLERHEQAIGRAHGRIDELQRRVT